ncbi:MAG: DUF2723 domain-containing protein [Chloroflexota bacterium]
MRTVHIVFTILIAGFYIYTLQPSLTWGDGARIQMEAISGESFPLSVLPDEMFSHDPYPFAKLSIAAWDHPLFVYLGYGLVNILPGVNALWLINLISAVFGAATIAVFFRISFDITGSLSASLLAALSLAFSHTFWFHAATPEVYTLLSFLVLVVIYFLIKFEITRRVSQLFWAALFFGMGAATHILSMLIVPPVLIYYWLYVRKSGSYTFATKTIGGVILSFTVGFLPFIIQFVRMLRVFPLAEIWKPAAGAMFLETSIGFSLGFALQGITTYLGYLFLQFNPISLLLGVVGLGWARKTYPGAWGKVLPLYLIYTLFGMAYQVVDQFAFLLMSHVFFAFAIALGVGVLINNLSSRKHQVLLGMGIVLTLGMPLFYRALPDIAARANITDETLGIPGVGSENMRSGITYYANPNKSGDTSAYEFGSRTLASLPADAIILAEWYTDTDEYLVFQYFSSIEKLRPDIEIIGWTLEDPFAFDAQIAINEIENHISGHPIYLASLSEEYYGVSKLAKKYCIVSELNLYRVYNRPPTANCLTIQN